MATLASNNSTEWARIVNTTMVKVVREVEDGVMFNRKVLAMLRSRGRVLTNQGGDGFKWPVRFRRASMTVNNGEQSLDFTRQNRWKWAFLDYQGYAIAEQITKREKLKNRGPEAKIKFFAQLGEMMLEDLEDQFAEELYVDSSATGNSQRWSGIETMMAATQTINVTDGTARSENAADPCFYPDDTYADLDTDLGAVAGSWSSQTDINSTWPFGRGTAGYDYWSPVIVKYDSNAFDGSSTTWAANAELATRFQIDAINTRVGLKTVDMITLDRGLFRQYKDKLDSKERIPVDSSNELKALGFKDVIEQDGVSITSEYGVPAGVGYAWAIDNLDLRTMQDNLFEVQGPIYREDIQAYRFCVDCLGQFRFRTPRNFGKLRT